MLAHSAWFILEGTEQVFIVHTAGNWAQTPRGRRGRIPKRLVPEAIPWALTDFPLQQITSIAERVDEILEAIGAAQPP